MVVYTNPLHCCVQDAVVIVPPFPYNIEEDLHDAPLEDCLGFRGSNIYEVNPWLWQFGRGKPRLGGLSIEQTGERKKVASDARHKRAAETKRARKTARS